jgi:hypothetical protein
MQLVTVISLYSTYSQLYNPFYKLLSFPFLWQFLLIRNRINKIVDLLLLGSFLPEFDKAIYIFSVIQ